MNVLAHLSEVKLEHVADVMWRALRQLHQLFPILKGLAQLLHTRLHSVYPVDTLSHNSRQCEITKSNNQMKKSLTHCLVCFKMPRCN